MELTWNIYNFNILDLLKMWGWELKVSRVSNKKSIEFNKILS